MPIRGPSAGHAALMVAAGHTNINDKYHNLGERVGDVHTLSAPLVIVVKDISIRLDVLCGSGQRTLACGTTCRLWLAVPELCTKNK